MTTPFDVRHLFSSLRARLLLLVVAAYLPAVGMTLWTVQRDRADALAAIQTRLLQLLADASVDNDAAILSGRRIVGTWSRVPALVYGDRAACEAELRSLLRFAPTVSSPTRIDSTGRVDCGGRDASSIGRYVGNNPIMSQVLATDSTVLGPYLKADSTREALVPLNIALRDSTGRARGVLSVGVRLSWLQTLARDTELPESTTVALADSTGLIIAALPLHANVGRRMPELAAVMADDRARGVAEQGATIRPTTLGYERLVAHRALTSAPGTFTRVAIAVPPEAAFAAPNERTRIRLALLLVTAIVALVIAWFGADIFVLRDVNAILGATRRLGTGDLSARTGVQHRRGEIAQLAESFDTMASQLELRQDRMRHAERMESLGRLAGGVAHDFNNLLTAIVGSADLALEELPPDHPVRAELATIKASASRSSTLTRQLLDFSRRTPLLTTPQPLEPIVLDAAALLGRVVPASVHITVESRSQRLVRSDAGRIEQALLNLAVNARDAMPTGGTLSIALEDVDIHGNAPDGRSGADATANLVGTVPPGAWVRLSVSDTGHGMTADVRRRVFEPFFTTKPVGQGTGLGLAMVYGTVQHHGGHVQIDSTPGEGTTVTMWFPAAPHVERQPVTPVRPIASIERPSQVLVAEDQDDVRTLVERVLTRAGYRVTLAEDGAQALQQVADMGNALDLLITDYDMPHARGDVVATAARERRADLPVLLISGFTSEGWPAELVQAPHTVVLEKPFSAQALLEAIERAVSGASASPHS
ncbi:ATP-binding protein [Gemmatimonas sp. UBA7669]|uniref:ATP-binding protein n=1 Tax=Gemmatimonas sp. UBA7669 TaxID=1946568 RepID=UPI0025C6B3FF|nr:ATP-binding protein [Gemmatimonas sp. UBA7669]